MVNLKITTFYSKYVGLVMINALDVEKKHLIVVTDDKVGYHCLNKHMHSM